MRRVVVRDGKRLREKDDESTLTAQVQGRNGLLLHLDAQLRKTANAKLRAILMRFLAAAIPVVDGPERQCGAMPRPRCGERLNL